MVNDDYFLFENLYILFLKIIFVKLWNRVTSFCCSAVKTIKHNFAIRKAKERKQKW